MSAAPLPPLGTLLTANQFPLSLSPETALAFVSTNVNPDWRPAQSGRALPWDAIGVLMLSLLIGTPILSLLGSIGAACA